MEYLEYSEWRDIDMHHEEKDAVEEALIERIHRLEKKAKEWMEKAQMAKGKGKGSLVATWTDFAKMEREEANMAIRALVKLRGGLTLRVVDCTVEVKRDVSDSEPGIETDPKSAA
jgi:vancomycin resistance protein YoaR